MKYEQSKKRWMVRRTEFFRLLIPRDGFWLWFFGRRITFLLRRRSIIAYVVLLVPIYASAEAIEETIWLPYPNGGITLGQGYDLVKNRKTPATCVDFVPVEDAGFETTYHISAINSFADVFSALEINSSGALDLSLFKANTKLKFVNNIKTSEANKYFMFTARMQRGVLYTSPTKSFKFGARNKEIDGGSEGSPTNKISFRDDLNIKDLINFSTYCGQGFVSAITTGIEIDAAINTSYKNQDSASALSGSLKLEALGGLIKGKGSIEGELAEAASSMQISVNSYIYGGESYSLPRNIEELRDFVKELPKLAAKKPSPLKIAITPYSAISSEKYGGIFSDSNVLNPIINSYFLAQEAQNRVSDILNQQENKDVKLLFLSNELELLTKFHDIGIDLSNLQAKLAKCRETLVKNNIDRSKTIEKIESQVSTNSYFLNLQKDAQIRTSNILNLAIDYPENDEGNEASAMDNPENDGGKEDSNVNNLLSCTVEDSTINAITNSLDNYLFSLVAMPIDLWGIDDPLVKQELFFDNIKFLLHNPVEIGELSSYAKTIKICENEAKARAIGAKNLLLLTGDNLDYRAKLDSWNIHALAKCENNEQQKQLLTTAKTNFVNTYKKNEAVIDALAIVKSVLAREIYKNRIYPLLMSMCKAEYQSEFCSYTYLAMLQMIRNQIELNDDDIETMAEITSVVDKEESSSKEKERLADKNKKFRDFDPCADMVERCE